MKMKFLLPLILLLVGCTQVVSPQMSATASPSPAATVNVQAPPQTQTDTCAPGVWCKSWSDVVITKLTPAMSSFNPGAKWCPNWAKVNRIDFWVAFVKSIVETESSFDTHNVYEENFENDDGENVLSIGLLQLSVEDQFSYPTAKSCKGITKANLQEPERNLKCGLEIMDRLITTKTPLPEYWSSTDFDKTGPETLSHLKKYFPACFSKR
jgi:hypothetical protein